MSFIFRYRPLHFVIKRNNNRASNSDKYYSKADRFEDSPMMSNIKSGQHQLNAARIYYSFK